MSGPRIYCLFVQGPGLSSEGSDALLLAAHTLMTEKSTKVRVSSPEFEGEVRTDYKHAALGCFGGYLFEGVIHTPRGKTTVEYIVSPKSLEVPLETRVWGTVFASEPLERGESAAGRPN